MDQQPTATEKWEMPKAELPLSLQAIMAVTIYLKDIEQQKRHCIESGCGKCWIEYSLELLTSTLNNLREAHTEFFDVLCACQESDAPVSDTRIKLMLTQNQINLVTFALSSNDFGDCMDEAYSFFAND